ncbi:Atu4866 domain-containing protein [Oryzicola mucosus]|uniref:Atu4866 domain-containing protein n=1 Tax=Oryzicola mucosus TaxID=2767425 RepID=A0A8J6U0G5_9HYPH|nr:Atu4866 domain-containing protein [Oryzicola mucosus]MBD0415631.1 Atu4866 domain-containing protein [Oryzicola mucosus]
MSNPLLIIVAIIIAASLGAVARISKEEDPIPTQSSTQAQPQNHPYLGMWVTGDGRIRQELLATGRYDEARGNRRSAYQGRYIVTGNNIDYWDDTGFTADGVFVDSDTLHHGGMIFYREKPSSASVVQRR